MIEVQGGYARQYSGLRIFSDGDMLPDEAEAHDVAPVEVSDAEGDQ